MRAIKSSWFAWETPNIKGQILLTLLLVFLLSSCELNSINLSCDDCYEVKPTQGMLYIDLAPVKYGDTIPVTVYKGKLENGIIFLQDTVTRNYLDIWVPVESFYTVVAEYKVDGSIIRAVDGDNVKVYLDESNCSNSCWRTRDGTADCRLR